MDEIYEIPDFIKQINAIMPDPEPTEKLTLDQFRMDTYYYQINNLDRLNEKDRFNFIKSNIDYIANQVLDGTCKYSKKLVDPIFLNTVKEVLKTMPITPARQFFINKLTYSYQYYSGATDNIQNLLMDVSRVVNAPYIRLLQSINLSEEHSAYLAMARFSSDDEMVNSNRLNYAIYCIGHEIMTEQQIIWIYEKLFDQIRYLFTATMLETKDAMQPPDGHDEEDFYETFSTVSLAILTIINNMTSADIDRLIRIYLDKWVASGSPRVRFSLRALSSDFGRIRTIVETLNEKYNIYIP